MRYIKRVSKVKNDDTKGYIINSTNVVDKEKNTYSANVIDGLVTNSTGWIQLTNSAGEHTVKYRKIGKIVELQIGIWRDNSDFNIAANGTVTIANLPEDCKPSINLTNAMFVSAKDKTVTPFVHLRVYTTGEIILQNWSKALECQYITGYISYVV